MRPVHRRRRRRAAFGLASLAGLLTVCAWQLMTSGAGAVTGELVAEPSYGAPTQVFLGASPEEAAGEVWATSGARESGTFARYTDADDWETLATPLDLEGDPIERLTFPSGSPDIGRTTPSGGIVAAGTALEPSPEAIEPGETQTLPLLVVRDPGDVPREAPEPPEALLGPREVFLDPEVEAPQLAALEAAEGKTRALLVPGTISGGPEAVLSLAGGNWSREPICVGFAPGPACTAPPTVFRVVAIEASEGEAWMLARNALPEEGIELFRREPGGGEGGATVWRQQSLGPAGSLGARFAEAEPLGVEVRARSAGQPLTVSGAGVWFDAQLIGPSGSAPATAYFDLAAGEVTGSWCDLEEPAGLCARPLENELPSAESRSFAWPPLDSGAEPFGRRAVTGLSQGALLELAGSSFERLAIAGGQAGTVLGAALSAPDEGWLGASPPLRLTRSPNPPHLTSWPVPFRRPLTAIAPEPGAALGTTGSEALAVGVSGEVARYQPGVGWQPEFLLTGSGKRATPTLRAVAWPEPGRAYAVGDGAAIWVWQKATELWSPDPAAPPKLLRANFTGIAFDPGDPSRGYIVGKQGVLLGYGRTWVEETLPAGIPAEANFTSIAFAGHEAIAVWKFPTSTAGGTYIGGVIVNDGSGWRVDEGAEVALEKASAAPVPQRVAGLADGGAVIAPIGGKMVVRQSAGAPWEATGARLVGFPAALAAFREEGRVRALVTVAVESSDIGVDKPQIESQPPPGQPPLLTEPYSLPTEGLLIRQTASGWRDEQHQAYPRPEREGGRRSYDLSGRPDPLLALLINPEGGEGWAVGGETGSLVTSTKTFREAVQTADVMRYGPAAASPSNASSAPIEPSVGPVQLAVGGGAQCAGPCANLGATGIAPERWLRSAVSAAAGVSGMRAFLYAGAGVATGGFDFSERLGATLSPPAFSREEKAYAQRLGASAGVLPTFAAASESDVDGNDSLETFRSAFSGFGSPFGQATPGAGITPVSDTAPGQAYYSFSSSGTGGTVRVIVLDYSLPTLGETQRCWLGGCRRPARPRPAGAERRSRQRPGAPDPDHRRLPHRLRADRRAGGRLGLLLRLPRTEPLLLAGFRWPLDPRLRHRGARLRRTAPARGKRLRWRGRLHDRLDRRR
jgi:hypothetical protein